ncbi:MAG: hypothetical protein H6510_17335 [Acidobacteria bacterium]|nr:hypothetical protein [Acidobacteriota bacterium]MCB9399578.1 hypothetical protein [Acidobacteriota bacterium]
MNVLTIMSCLVGTAWVCGPQVPCYLYYGVANRQDLVQGRIGIIEPDFPTSAKIVFYRHLTGLGLSPENQTQVLQYWARFWRYGHNPLPYHPSSEPEPLQLWFQARAGVPGAGPNPPINPFDMQDFTEYVNCGDDAFRSAAHRLTQFLNQHGAGPAIQEWLRGQDAVFCHCGPTPASDFPAPIQEDWPDWLKQERQYQLASAAFYAGDLASAAEQFRVIENNPQSPYNSIGGYLAARALFRRAQFADSASEGLAIAQQALDQINAYLANSPALLLDAQKLRLRILARFFGASALTELGKILSQPGSIENFEVVLWQYVNLFEAGFQPQQPDPLFTWLSSFSSGRAGNLESSNPNRLTQLYSVKADDPQLSALLAWVDTLQPDNPAYATALARAISLNTQSGHLQAARRHWAKLQQFAATRPEDIPLANECASLGLSLCEDWPSLFARLPRKVWATDFQTDFGQSVEWNFDQDALALFNSYLPLNRWIQFAQSPHLPERLRLGVAEVAMTRALLLQDFQALEAITKLLPKTNAYQSVSEHLLTLTDPEETKIQTVFFLLQNPGLTIELRANRFEWVDPAYSDSIRGNWWPSQIQYFYGWRAPYAESKGQGLLKIPVVVTGNEQDQAEQELQKLKQCVPAPDYMTRQWLALAESYPNHPLIAEGLFLAIRATRYGERGEQTSQWSRRAFTLLHKRYPDSEWAKKAKYWY